MPFNPNDLGKQRIDVNFRENAIEMVQMRRNYTIRKLLSQHLSVLQPMTILGANAEAPPQQQHIQTSRYIQTARLNDRNEIGEQSW
jgi:hypothetical protein